jgi:hypothetical protein
MHAHCEKCNMSKEVPGACLLFESPLQDECICCDLRVYEARQRRGTFLIRTAMVCGIIAAWILVTILIH